MGWRKKLLKKARDNPAGLKYAELRRLADHFFTQDRQRGSHVIYKIPGQQRLLNFQDNKGQAHGYQVKQLLATLDDLDLIPEEER